MNTPATTAPRLAGKYLTVDPDLEACGIRAAHHQPKPGF